MELPVKFDLSNLSATGFAQITFPLLPGGILVLGTAVLHPDLAQKFFTLPYLGYFAKAAVALFAAYVLGLFVAMSVVGIVGGVAGFVGTLLGSHLPWKWKPWRDDVWRETEKRFIGYRFTPIVDLPIDADLLKMQFESVRSNPAEGIKILNAQADRSLADYKWSRWYWILESYFAFPSPPPDVGTYMSQAAHCAAWAVIILMYWGPFHHPALWAICWLIVGGSFLEYLFLCLNPKIESAGAARQTAAMLRLLTMRSQSQNSGAEAQPAEAP